MSHSLADTLTSSLPFALIARDSESVELLTGTARDVAALADIPLHSQHGTAQEVLALVPYRQITERGYACLDDHAPLRCLIVDEHSAIERALLIEQLPTSAPPLEGSFETGDAEYEATVQRVLEEEIGAGEGANFVIRRDFVAELPGDALPLALAWFRRLLEHERGAYWSFIVATDDLILVGASPEAHVTLSNGEVTMNPISGTLRHRGDNGATADELTAFLSDTKETEELFMVVDEELKMMAEVCDTGGHIEGPTLKRMSQLTHTEYRLRGRTTLDARDVIRATMFAPTVTGSPMQNACAVIARHERAPRGYYSGVAALFTPSESGHDLDAPILIRTAQLSGSEVRVSVGATLVQQSRPADEVLETHAKSASMLQAIGAIAPITPQGHSVQPEPPHLETLLRQRNERLAPFWLAPQRVTPDAPYTGYTALVVDAEDRFTTMLAHQLRHLGFAVRVRGWSEVGDLFAPDLLVAGPGPGDPRGRTDARIARMQDIIATRLASGRPLLAVCLSHQILADQLGLSIEPLPTARQGVQLSIDLFGSQATIGFYNSFTATMPSGVDHTPPNIALTDIAACEHSGDVFALRGTGFASVQGHLESVLSRDGLSTLRRLIDGLSIKR